MGRLTPILHAADEPETEPVRPSGWDAAAAHQQQQEANAAPAVLGADKLIDAHDRINSQVVEFATNLIDSHIARLEELKSRIKLQGEDAAGRVKAFIQMVDEGLKDAADLSGVVKKVEGLL